MGCHAPTSGNPAVTSDCTLNTPAGHLQSPLLRDPERIPGDGFVLAGERSCHPTQGFGGDKHIAMLRNNSFHGSTLHPWARCPSGLSR